MVQAERLKFMAWSLAVTDNGHTHGHDPGAVKMKAAALVGVFIFFIGHDLKASPLELATKSHFSEDPRIVDVSYESNQQNIRRSQTEKEIVIDVPASIDRPFNPLAANQPGPGPGDAVD